MAVNELPDAYAPEDPGVDVFEAFASMVTSLRNKHEADLKQLSDAIVKLKEKGYDVAPLEKLRDEMQARLDM